jgi:hypothetical protein
MLILSVLFRLTTLEVSSLLECDTVSLPTGFLTLWRTAVAVPSGASSYTSWNLDSISNYLPNVAVQDPRRIKNFSNTICENLISDSTFTLFLITLQAFLKKIYNCNYDSLEILWILLNCLNINVKSVMDTSQQNACSFSPSTAFITKFFTIDYFILFLKLYNLPPPHTHTHARAHARTHRGCFRRNSKYIRW